MRIIETTRDTGPCHCATVHNSVGVTGSLQILSVVDGWPKKGNIKLGLSIVWGWQVKIRGEEG